MEYSGAENRYFDILFCYIFLFFEILVYLARLDIIPYTKRPLYCFLQNSMLCILVFSDVYEYLKRGEICTNIGNSSKIPQTFNETEFTVAAISQFVHLYTQSWSIYLNEKKNVFAKY